MLSRPLMRRMNSMLLGHQGASGRTDCMYFSMARRVAGSSQDSGNQTVREGTTSWSVSPRASSAASTASMSVRWSMTPGSKCSCSERMPGVMSTMPGSWRACSASIRPWARRRRPMSSCISPSSTSR